MSNIFKTFQWYQQSYFILFHKQKAIVSTSCFPQTPVERSRPTQKRSMTKSFLQPAEYLLHTHIECLFILQYYLRRLIFSKQFKVLPRSRKLQIHFPRGKQFVNNCPTVRHKCQSGLLFLILPRVVFISGTVFTLFMKIINYFRFWARRHGCPSLTIMCFLFISVNTRNRSKNRSDFHI